jgi:hypothetical protein
MLYEYVWYVQLTKAKHIHKRQIYPLTRKNITQGLWLYGFKLKKKKKPLKPQEAWHQYDLLGGKLPVVQQLQVWL